MIDNDDDIRAWWPEGCPDARTLNDYADGSLEVEQRPRVDAHLVVCPECRVWVTDLFSVMALLGDPKSLPAPRSFRLGPEHRRPANGKHAPNGDSSTR